MKSLWILALGASLCIAAPVAVAQVQPPTDSQSAPRFVQTPPLFFLGGVAEDEARLNQLRGAPTDGWLLRAPSTLLPRLSGSSTRLGRRYGCDLRWSLLAPAVLAGWNSQVPPERNDGSAWEGRGAFTTVRAGARVECGRLRMIVAPEFSYTQNRPFPILVPMAPRLSGFANPFYSGRDASADLPLRFGNAPITTIAPGQTAAELDLSPVVVGVGTQSQWWGPGVRNGIVMSSHATGIPSFYLRTAQPIRTRFASAEARWIVGALSESPYFDFDPSNDLRSLSGLVVTITPAADTTFTFGGARVVFAPIPSVGALPARFLDAVIRIGEGGNVRASTFGRAADQLMTLFARWVPNHSGVEAYAEWSRILLPTSLRGLLLDPQQSQGYTVGLQWISGLDPARAYWRVQAEATQLEQRRTNRSDSPQSFYVSPAVAQGYTQRGRTIGAAIGPGGNSQFVGVDDMHPAWSVGLTAGRVHWNGEEFYRQITGFSVFAHDVSIFGGVRAQRSFARFVLSSELVSEQRLHYLFQSAVYGYSEDRTYDVISNSLRFGITPR